MATTKDKILGVAEEKKPQPSPPVISPQKQEEVKQEMQQTMQATMPKPIASTEVLKTEQAERKPTNYAELNEMLSPITPPTPLELAEDRRKRRSKAVVSAIGDGLSSLANIYFTTKGAPAVKYDPRGSLSERNKARWDKIDQMRDEKMTRYATDKMKAMEADIRQKNAEKLLDLRAKMNEAEAQARADLHAQDDAAKVEHTNLVNAFKAEESAKKQEGAMAKQKDAQAFRASDREDRQAHSAEEAQKKRDHQVEENDKSRQAKKQNIIIAGQVKDGSYEDEDYSQYLQQDEEDYSQYIQK